MVVLIAEIGNFQLRRKTFLSEHKYMTHDLEIVKKEMRNNEQYVYTIADFNDEGEIVSCGTRLLESIESEDDLEYVKELSHIASHIISTRNVETDYVSESKKVA